MGAKYKIAVFDLDGTILDTSEGVCAAVRYTIDHFGLKPLEDDDLRKFIGPPIQDSFATVYGLEGSILQEIATVFRNQYKEKDLLKAVPYEGIFHVFESLLQNGVKPAVATYKRQDYALEMLRHFGFDKYTDVMYGADHENRLKKSDIIEMAIRSAGVQDYTRAVMIGDSNNDAIGAEKLGVPFVGVTYGFGFKCDSDVRKFPNEGVAGSAYELERLLIS